jgi:hypothetical protein
VVVLSSHIANVESGKISGSWGLAESWNFKKLCILILWDWKSLKEHL